MSDQPRLLTVARDSMAEAKCAFYTALNDDGVITTEEAWDIIPHFDASYHYIEEAEGVEVAYEAARKKGVEAALSKPNREAIASLVEYRQRKEARQREATEGTNPPAA